MTKKYFTSIKNKYFGNQSNAQKTKIIKNLLSNYKSLKNLNIWQLLIASNNLIWNNNNNTQSFEESFREIVDIHDYLTLAFLYFQQNN